MPRSALTVTSGSRDGVEHDGRQATSMERMILGRTCLETYRLGFDGIPIQTVLGV